MEQRPLRLGDIVDDYCPRERRITNHAIVALIDNAIRQTRCSTCDAEHVYKGARLPKRRKKDDETLYDQVLASVGGAAVTAVPPTHTEQMPTHEPTAAVLQAARNGQPAAEPAGAGAAETSQPEADRRDIGQPDAQPDTGELWGGHRRLIRASLPKTEGDLPPPRPIPEFTMHHRAHRDGFYRGHGQEGNGPTRDVRGQGRPGNGHGQGQNQGEGDRPHRGGRGRRHRGRNKRPR